MVNVSKEDLSIWEHGIARAFATLPNTQEGRAAKMLLEDILKEINEKLAV